ncbi:putative Iron-sulfur protein NUBPL [Nannochloris sp. 'desiccata']|nr:hypothetical protein KSW81_000083 [Chlorella desiccata (nom. nud.)]KAH7619911.1 putative Iron-sulfur protein NUBPL [Chlorella desiccata (nom. nud.)]
MARRKIQGTAIPVLQSLFRTYASPAATSRPPVSKLGIPNVDHIIAVASGKGGVGKSTTAVNLAVAMAQNLGLRIGVLDADIYGPSIPRLLHLHGKPDVDSNDLMLPLKNHGVTAMSMGFLIEEDSAAVWRGPMVMSALDTFIRKVNWGNLDCLVIDMPPGTGDAQITISQRLALSGAVIVSTPQDLALLDARRGVTMFRKVSVPILGIIENMSWFVCGNCGTEAHVFGHGGCTKTAKDMDMEVLGEIPLHIDIRETSDAGVPIVVSKPESVAAKAYVSVAERVWQQLQEGNCGGGQAGPPKIEIRK